MTDDNDEYEPVIHVSQDVCESFQSVYQLERKNLYRILSRPPLITVIRVNTAKVPIQDAIRKLTDHLDSNDPYWNKRILQHPTYTDTLIVACSRNQNERANTRRKAIGEEKSSGELHGSGVIAKEVIVDTLCGNAVLRGADIFKVGVLSAHAGMRIGDTVQIYCDVDKKCCRGHTQEFTGRKLYLGEGTSLVDRNELYSRHSSELEGVGIKVTNPIYCLPSFASLDSGLFFPQNFPSLAVGHLLSPLPSGATVLDMCASPGGKSTHVAQLLAGTGSVVSIDKSKVKVDRILANCRNLGLTNIRAYAFDSTKICCKTMPAKADAGDKPQPTTDNDDITFLSPPYPPMHFDYIILDPPCSGLGQRPQLRVTATHRDLNSCQCIQRRLIDQALLLLRPGGYLVYSTCTIRPQENEENVLHILQKSNMSLCELAPEMRLGRPGLEGYGLSKEQLQNVQRFDFCYSKDQMVEEEFEDASDEGLLRRASKDTIGFFVAKFVKSM